MLRGRSFRPEEQPQARRRRAGASKIGGRGQAPPLRKEGVFPQARGLGLLFLPPLCPLSIKRQ